MPRQSLIGILYTEVTQKVRQMCCHVTSFSKWTGIITTNLAYGQNPHWLAAGRTGEPFWKSEFESQDKWSVWGIEGNIFIWAGVNLECVDFAENREQLAIRDDNILDLHGISLRRQWQCNAPARPQVAALNNSERLGSIDCTPVARWLVVPSPDDFALVQASCDCRESFQSSAAAFRATAGNRPSLTLLFFFRQ